MVFCYSGQLVSYGSLESLGKLERAEGHAMGVWGPEAWVRVPMRMGARTRALGAGTHAMGARTRCS